MLTTLRIRNLALVADLTLEFPPGLVAVTGETGAGKSVVLGALNLLLGGRADRTLLRAGEDTCTVEAVLDVSALPAAFGEAVAAAGVEPCEGGQLLLKRTFTAAGANRQFVNGTPATLGVLASLGDWLVDIHGPHDHQSLLHPARQLALLDAFGGLGDRVRAFRDLLEHRRALEAEKAALVVDEETYARQLDLLRFQSGEIAAAALQPDEEEPLLAEHRRAANAVQLLQLGQAALERLAGEDGSLLIQAGAVGRLLQDLQRLDPQARCLTSLHEQAVSAVRDLQSDLGHYLERIELDPERFAALEERLNVLQTLKRKYGPTLAAVIESGEEARRRLAQLEARDTELQRLNAGIGELDRKLETAGRQLGEARRALIPRLAGAVTRQLTDLGFQRSAFDIALSPAPAPTASGLDAVEFQFAPNPGEPARPLRAIASSGEMARVMLALKTVLAAEDEIPVLVFDEVDANVGGETARAVGEKMRQIARRRQVFCVTHLAPVAAAADAHFVVSKEVRDGRTLTRVERTDGPERVTELARMLGGQSDAARRHAASLLAPGSGRER